jgi:hypothetical protein
VCYIPPCRANLVPLTGGCNSHASPGHVYPCRCWQSVPPWLWTAASFRVGTLRAPTCPCLQPQPLVPLYRHHPPSRRPPAATAAPPHPSLRSAAPRRADYSIGGPCAREADYRLKALFVVFVVFMVHMPPERTIATFPCAPSKRTIGRVCAFGRGTCGPWGTRRRQRQTNAAGLQPAQDDVE